MFYEICPAGGGGCWYGYDSEFASKRAQFEGKGWIFQASGTICKYDDEGICQTGGYYNYLGEDSRWKKILYGYKSFMDNVAEGIEKCEANPLCGIGMAALMMTEGRIPSGKRLPFKDSNLSERIEKVLDDIAAGVKNFKKDGTIFRNLENKLPAKVEGYYKEFTVPTPGAADRGKARVVTGAGGEVYFTPDHYESVVRVK